MVCVHQHSGDVHENLSKVTRRSFRATNIWPSILLTFSPSEATPLTGMHFPELKQFYKVACHFGCILKLTVRASSCLIPRWRGLPICNTLACPKENQSCYPSFPISVCCSLWAHSMWWQRWTGLLWAESSSWWRPEIFSPRSSSTFLLQTM